MTLVEVVIATGVTAILAMMVGAGISYSGRGLSALWNYIDMDNSARSAIDTMQTAIRQADSILTVSTNDLVILNTDGTTNEYKYDSYHQTLTYTNGNYSKVLLTNCQSLTFLGFSRTPQQLSWDPYSATSGSYCKMVQIQWTCYRTVLGTLKQTESVQTARVVVRNNHTY